MLRQAIVLFIFQVLLIHKGKSSDTSDRLSVVEKELSDVKSELDILRRQISYLIKQNSENLKSEEESTFFDRIMTISDNHKEELDSW